MVVEQLSGEASGRHRLVDAIGPMRIGQDRVLRYRFRHQLFQEYAYTLLDEVERPHFHARVATALESLVTGSRDMWLGELARHFEATTALGNPQEGVALTERGVDLYRGLAPPPIFWPLVLGMRSAVQAMAGELPRALELMDEAIAIWESTGMMPPELWVRRGDLLHTMRGDADPEVLELYERAAEGADALRLRLPGLRAHTRLVRIRRALGAEDDGSVELADLLDTFTEGHDEADVVVARDTLDA